MSDGESFHPGSFRDPSGKLFARQGVLYRQVNESYRDDYKLLMDSGLYGQLVETGLLIAHTEVEVVPVNATRAYKVIRPEVIPFISYPYEWCFSQLKHGALATLDIQEKAMSCGMTLKDASAYNIQFVAGKPVLIDTLSFERYREGTPWVAYRQFCCHFLTPLALMSYTDVRLSQLMRIHIDGVPLDLASGLLPARTRLRFGLLTHLHLHARSEKHYEKKAVDTSRIGGVSRNALLGLLVSLRKTVQKLQWKAAGTEWAEYYDETNYTEASLEHKKRLVSEYLDRVDPGNLWDMGANIGLFSRISAEKGISTVSIDVDPACVERNYLDCLERGDESVLPLLVDFTNPSPALGWNNRERESLMERGPADAVLALALVHHLAISNNVPLELLADFFAELCTHLIVEFVPKEDSQVQLLLLSREDIFSGYDRPHFESALEKRFQIIDRAEIEESKRTLYLMEKRGG